MPTPHLTQLVDMLIDTRIEGRLRVSAIVSTQHSGTGLQKSCEQRRLELPRDEEDHACDRAHHEQDVAQNDIRPRRGWKEEMVARLDAEIVQGHQLSRLLVNGEQLLAAALQLHPVHASVGTYPAGEHEHLRDEHRALNVIKAGLSDISKNPNALGGPHPYLGLPKVRGKITSEGRLPFRIQHAVQTDGRDIGKVERPIGLDGELPRPLLLAGHEVDHVAHVEVAFTKAPLDDLEANRAGAVVGGAAPRSDIREK